MDRKEYDRQYHANRSPEKKARKLLLQKERLREIRAWLDEYKTSLRCACGESHPACLDFHHSSSDKEINIADAVRLGWGLDRIRNEINKCVVVCANCHRKLHYDHDKKTNAASR